MSVELDKTTLDFAVRTTPEHCEGRDSYLPVRRVRSVWRLRLLFTFQVVGGSCRPGRAWAPSVSVRRIHHWSAQAQVLNPVAV